MGSFVNNKALAGSAWVVAIVIMSLNAWLLLGVFREWLA
jgi:Mn2+/Fe2+ NRAMP family transporter